MKNNIRIVVQGGNQTGKEFAEELEELCEYLSKEFDDTLGVNVPKVAFMTSASNGRQTATIQFTTFTK